MSEPVSTFGFLSVFPTQPFGLGPEDYGIQVVPSLGSALEESPGTRPMSSGAYFVKIPEAARIQCLYFNGGTCYASPDEPQMIRPRGIISSLRDFTAKLYFEARDAWRVGEETRLLPPQEERNWLVQEKKDISRVVQTFQVVRSLPSALLESVSDLAGLEQGWNSYSAPAPNALAIENAKTILMKAAAVGIIADRVEPSAMGGVGVVFTTGTKEAVVEFYNAGNAHALFADNDSQEMRTERVPISGYGYGDFLEKVHNYLYGHDTAPQTCGSEFP